MNKHKPIAFCKQCGFELHKRQTVFCSRNCNASYHLADKSRRSKGTGKKHIRIRVAGKYVYEHRHLIETHVRKLEAGEIVHHKDGNRFNNALDNLEILSGRAAHLHCHNYYRKTMTKDEASETDILEYGF